jgi:phosphoribosylamine--glycine ligase
MMKILVVGGGGREHAIASALGRNTKTEIYSVMARRNPGIDALAKKVHLCKETDSKNVVSFAREVGAAYAFIGPEAPLVLLMPSDLPASRASARHRQQPAWKPTRRSVGK